MKGILFFASGFNYIGKQLHIWRIMEIKIGNIESIELRQLLEEHHEDMLKHSPKKSVHALDLSSFVSADITFWTLYINDELAGCAALKKLNEKHAELKSMRTSPHYLRKGVASTLLTHVLKMAKEQCFEKISLETGTMKVFAPAQKLYLAFGFEVCEPFSDYKEDSYSMFLTKTIN